MVTLRSSKSRRGGTGRTISVPWKVLLCSCTTGIVGFYVGLLLGSQAHHSNGTPPMQEAPLTNDKRTLVKKETHASPFSDGLKEVAINYRELPRDAVAEFLDTGVPLDPSTSRNHQVLVIYQSQDSLPSSSSNVHTAQSNNDPEIALQNCDQVHLILTQPRQRRQCTILMGQYESFHVQKFMRLPATKKGALDSTLPLRLVNRGAQANGRKSTTPPTVEETTEYWEILAQHLSHYSGMLEDLDRVAQTVVNKATNTIIVMVCNFGQSELLLNFWCNAQHKGLELSHILVFCTDTETRDVLQNATTLSVFYDEHLASSMPNIAARRYGDNIFAKIMLAKVHCVQSLVFLNYNVLFQDVDVIWYKEVLPYFEAQHEKYDVYFQDDGNHALYYAPYSANTGFYYVQANERTRHLFNTLLLSGDLIASTRSHQIPMVSLLAEHASMYGLKVKIWNRLENDFPGGHAFHRRKQFMKEIVGGQYVPYMFHMSWTTNKKNKVKFYKQFGEWYLQESCAAVEAHKLPEDKNCCAAEPLLACFYSDKPSKKPCRDSPAIDKGGRSFW